MFPSQIQDEKDGGIKIDSEAVKTLDTPQIFLEFVSPQMYRRGNEIEKRRRGRRQRLVRNDQNFQNFRKLEGFRKSSISGTVDQR